MTRFNYLPLIDKLAHCGFAKVFHTSVVDKGDKCRLLIGFERDAYEFVETVRRNKKVLREQVMTIIERERLSEDQALFSVSVTYSGDAYWVEIYIPLEPLPSSDKSESKDKCPSCGSTL